MALKIFDNVTKRLLSSMAQIKKGVDCIQYLTTSVA